MIQLIDHSVTRPNNMDVVEAPNLNRYRIEAARFNHKHSKPTHDPSFNHKLETE